MASTWNGLVSTIAKQVCMRELTLTVIVLIAAEILVAAVNIVVDLYAGVD